MMIKSRHGKYQCTLVCYFVAYTPVTVSPVAGWEVGIGRLSGVPECLKCLGIGIVFYILIICT